MLCQSPSGRIYLGSLIWKEIHQYFLKVVFSKYNTQPSHFALCKTLCFSEYNKNTIWLMSAFFNQNSILPPKWPRWKTKVNFILSIVIIAKKPLYTYLNVGNDLPKHWKNWRFLNFYWSWHEIMNFERERKKYITSDLITDLLFQEEK